MIFNIEGVCGDTGRAFVKIERVGNVYNAVVLTKQGETSERTFEEFDEAKTWSEVQAGIYGFGTIYWRDT